MRFGFLYGGFRNAKMPDLLFCTGVFFLPERNLYVDMQLITYNGGSI
jgi:hypothetical protein